MKNDMSRRFHTRVMTNIIFSTIFACLVDLFLVTNLTMLGENLPSGRGGRTLCRRLSAIRIPSLSYCMCWQASEPSLCPSLCCREIP